MNVLGVWDGHDSGAVLLQDGRLQFAVNEERLTRRKLEIRFPTRSIEACLAHAGLTAGQVDVVAASTSDPAKTLSRWWTGSKERYYSVRRRRAQPGPFAALTRAAKYRITEWPPGPASRALSRIALQKQLVRHALTNADLIVVDHHEAHAAGAAWAAGAADGLPRAVLTIDGVGDGLSSTLSIFRNGRLERVAASSARNSLGVFFEHVTGLLNMRELEDEGKVMALADYAAPIADDANPLLAWIRVREGVIETSRPGHSARRALARIHWQYPNEQFAYLAQRVVEHTCAALARDAVRLTGLDRLALAGGVVSNIRATRCIRLLPEVKDVSVFPHMGDGGLALGAAAAVAAAAGDPVALDLSRLDLGPGYAVSEIAAALRTAGFTAEPVNGLAARVADALADGRIVMWFQGRMEYGPRALGNRSVLARPDRVAVRDRLNLVLKRRVWYQPFCPSMLESEARRVLADWSSPSNRSMTMAYTVSACFRDRLAGVVSIDGTCRPQCVGDDDPGEFAELLREARTRWAVGAVLNTSFNIHGEPIVCTPAEAIDVFVRSGADALAIGPFFVERPVPQAGSPSAHRSEPVSGVDPPRRLRSRWLAVACAWIACLAVELLWVLRTPLVSLREQLTVFQFWSLETCVVLGLAVGAVALRDIARLIERRDLWAIALPLALALGLTLGVVPRTNRIYYDEQIYQNIGQNLADSKRAQLCNDGTIENGHLQCSIGEYNKQPYAYPHVLSLAFRAFGVGTTSAFVVNAVVAGLSVCVVYLLVLILFSDRVAAFFAALLLALTPEQLLWSATGAVEPSASFMCMAALLAAACFIRSRRMAALVGAAVALAYAIQFRPESLLLVPVIGLLIWQRAREEFARPRIWWAGLLFFALAAVHFGHLAAVRNEGWGTTQDRLSLAYVASNLSVNGWFYLADARFPPTYTLLAVLGLSGRRGEPGRLPMAVYFLLFFGVALLFYAGSYNYGADVRYSLATYPPLVVLGGLGAARAVRWFGRVVPKRPAFACMTFALVIQFVWYLAVIRSTTDSAWASRADVQFATSLVPDLQGKSYVLTHNPGMFQVWGIDAGQMSLVAANPAKLDELAARYPGRLYLHWNFWCNVQDPVQRGFCTRILDLRPGEPVREHRERDQHYVLYKLKDPVRRP